LRPALPGGLDAHAVPKLFATGERVLLTAGQMDSFGYLFLSALVLPPTIYPTSQRIPFLPATVMQIPKLKSPMTIPSMNTFCCAVWDCIKI
jgi:hypothetical protein